MENSSLVVILVWAISVFYCLIKLRNLRFDPAASALWTLVILFLPYLGALAFLLVRPMAASRGQNGVVVRPTDENKALLRRYSEEVWEKQNPGAVKQFLAPNYKRHTSPITQPRSLEDQIQRLVGFRTAFPDIQITIEEMIAEGNLISFRSTMRGTHQGEFLGIKPTGREVTVYLLDIVRIENGKFIEQWGGPDLLDLSFQLGAEIAGP